MAASDGCVSVAAQFLRTGYSATSPNWDFSRYQANVVVINLGTNDKSHSVSSADFQNGYVAFLRTVRSKYPNSVILALQTFSNRYTAETKAAVNTVVAAGDSRVQFVDTTGWINSSLLSDSVHPNDAGHAAITAKLAPIVSAALARSTTAPTTSAPTSRPPVTSAAVTSGAPGDQRGRHERGGDQRGRHQCACHERGRHQRGCHLAAHQRAAPVGRVPGHLRHHQ